MEATLAQNTKSSLQNNPFWLLGINTRDSRHKIMEQAEERALHFNHAECQKARSDLTNPRSRLSAEVSWVPGVSPNMAEKIIAGLGCDPLSIASQTGLPKLAHANLMAAALELVDPTGSSISTLADYMQQLGEVADSIETESTLRDINEDRSVAGFPDVRDLAAVEEEIDARKKQYKVILKNTLNNMPSSMLVETITLLVEQSTAFGESPSPSLVDDLVGSYEIETQGFLNKEQENLTTILESTLAAAPLGVESVDLRLAKLDHVLRNWCRVSKPIQMSMRARGLEHQASNRLAYQVRSMGIDLYNKHDLIVQAEHITKLILEIFDNLPEIMEKVQADADTLLQRKKEKSGSERRDAEWREAITYRTEIGIVFKDELNIGANGISWKNVTYPLDKINGVRWGAVKKSVNGIPTGTNYTIAFGDDNSSSMVSLSREDVYSKFINCLWRAVCIRLLIGMAKSLKDGQTLSFGTLQVRDDSVLLERHKFFGANEWVWMKLNEVRIWSANGSCYIGSQSDKKTYGHSSYINHWNTHILERLVHGSFKGGGSKLSSHLEN